MIPVRLELKNFLPYRAPDPIRFEGIHLACLTGANGAGKSSILDAITWVLWGKARAKRDEELVHLGQGEMSVQLDFEQEGVTYRVYRQRSAGKKGEGRLNLFILQEGEKPRIESEPSMTLTQKKINALLRLDYETFVHSAFLQQGKADAFTTRTPAQRKQILSDILGLEQWERYEEIAKDRQKAITAQLATIEERIKEIDSELLRRPALEKDRASAAQTHVEAQEILVIAEAQLKKVESAPAELRAVQENKKDRERRLKENKREHLEVEERIARQQKQIAEYNDIITSRANIESGYLALQSAREADQTLSDKLRLLKTLDDSRYELRSQLDSARARLETEADSLRRSISELTAVVSTDYAADLQIVQSEVAVLQDIQIQHDLLVEQINIQREQQAELKTLKKALTQEGIDLKEKLEMLSLTDAAVCPLCGQPLDVEHRQQMVAQLDIDIVEKREAYRQNKEDIGASEIQIAEARSQLKDLEAGLKQLSPLMERAGALQAQADAAHHAEMRLAEENDRLQQIEVELMSDSFAVDVREQLVVLDGQQVELGYDENSHDDARNQLENYNRYDKLQTRLTIALESLATLHDAIAGSQARFDRLMQVINELEAELITFEGEIVRLELLVAEFNAREEEVKRERTRERNAYERLVSAEQMLKSLDAQAERKAQLEIRREKSRYDEALYNELKRAFGKNGIPAMIIETAIPELEVTANDLLTRMTDGRMHLKLNTQREKVTGGVQETLDIEIADELGTRAYEMYSGGEAFRINFALRVALSQMLSRRAGAQLRTLFIDEGFGTQDEEGRNKLVEAITAIQDDFALILVITHIDELRDSFPVHIMVDKTSNGSRVVVR